MNYDNENRGKIQYRNRKRQIIDFSGLRYGNITPTDIDGYLEYHDKAMIFIELKHNDAQVPYGQRLALERSVDNNAAAGKKSVLFVCQHYVDDPDQDIIAANAIVKEVYYKGKYIYPMKEFTLKQLLDYFIEMVDSELFF